MEKFDVIVVGAGLAGLAAAWTLAGEGCEVLVLERGDYPGAKNLSGGRLYVNPVRDLFPGLWEDIPMERFIAHEGITIMAKERSITLDYSGNELRQKPHQSWSVLRSKFDHWLSEHVEIRGGTILPKVRVDEIVRENGKVCGVVAGGDDLRADVVIACDGVLSIVAEKAGLRNPGKPRDYALGIKELISLDAGIINDRFNLEGNEGAARLFAGEVTKGRFGGGFVYTNKDSLSLGIVLGISDFLNAGIVVPTLLDEFKTRPEVAALVRGGKTIEYGAHVIPESGYRNLTTLHGDGILVAGDAAGFALNIGFTVRGMEYALASGHLAAKAVLEAKRRRDFSSATLAYFQTLLEESFVLQDMKSFRKAPDVVRNPRFFSHYPGIWGDMFRDVYNIPAGAKNQIYPTVRKFLTIGEMCAMFKDMRGMTKI